MGGEDEAGSADILTLGWALYGQGRWPSILWGWSLWSTGGGAKVSELGILSLKLPRRSGPGTPEAGRHQGGGAWEAKYGAARREFAMLRAET